MSSLVEDSLPMIYTVPDLARVTVAAAAAGVPGTSGEVEFSFPTMREVTGVLVLPADGNPATLAGLALQIFDEDDKPLFSDLLGDELAFGAIPFAMGCLAMAGRALRPFPLQRVVRGSTRWRLTLFNVSAAAIDVASVGLYHRSVE